MSGQKHLSDDARERMLSELAQHYGEPVRPVSEYCAAFEAWFDALQAKAKREDDDVEHRPFRDENLRRIAEIRPQLAMAIYKSALLGRMVYGGESLRTRMCPEHKGVWSGLAWGRNDCPHGCQLTGWLPETAPSAPTRPSDPAGGETARFTTEEPS